jgi:uncharacterized membrane protein YqgA involved in biofilm formation
MTGTFINVVAIVAGALLGTMLGHRLPDRLQQRVLAGLGLATLVIGVDGALAWRDTNVLYVIGGLLLGGLAGEALNIENRLERLGARLQRRFSGPGHSTFAEGFFTASLLFVVGAMAVLGSIEDGLTGDYDTLATKALLDGFASIALAAALGIGVAFSAVSVLLYQGAITLAAGLFDEVLAEGTEALAALTSVGGILIIGIALRLLDLKDVKVGNFLPALIFAPCLVGVVSLLSG